MHKYDPLSEDQVALPKILGANTNTIAKPLQSCFFIQVSL